MQRKKNKKDRLKTVTPKGHLAILRSLPPSGEIFINNVLASEALTPETLREWCTPNLTPRCPYCNTCAPATLHLLT